VYNFERGSPIRQILYLVVVEGAVRFGIVGGLLMTAATAPVLVVYEHLRVEHLGGDFRIDYVTLQLTGEAIVGLIVGWLVSRLVRQSAISDERASEAEALRDVLGRRVDVLEAANRCARALSSSLLLDEAFEAFIRGLRGVVPFDRIAVILREGDRLEVLATAGEGADEIFPPGTTRPTSGSIFEAVSARGTVYRADMDDRAYLEEEDLLRLGLRSRLVAPLAVAGEPLGLIAFVRREPDGFTTEEVALVALLRPLAPT